MKLTSCQTQAKVKLEEWVDRPTTTSLSDRAFLITGKAGTGKTTLIKYVLAKFLKDEPSPITRYAYPAVAGVCIAHKAKNVLRGSIPDCFTYAKFFGQQVIYRQDGQMDFQKKHAPFHKFPYELPINFVVFDECSMYDMARMREILDTVHPLTKIIFMGDPGQLPPINSDGIDLDSPVFGLDLPESSKHHLEERVRQTDQNPIVPLSDIIYEEIFGQKRFKPVYEMIRQQHKIGQGEGYEVTSLFDMVEKYIEVSKGDPLETKVVCFRNKTVDETNQAIRNRLFGTFDSNGEFIPPPDVFMPGDSIVLNNTFTQWNDKHEKAGYPFYNSDEYLISGVVTTELEGIKSYVLRVELPEGPHHLKAIKQPIIHVVHSEGYREYRNRLNELYAIAEAEKDRNKRRELFQDYHEFKGMWADVSYGFAFTAYKAQGSTYRNVFVDVNDIRETYGLTKKRKLQSMYTATTRASHNVYFLSQT